MYVILLTDVQITSCSIRRSPFCNHEKLIAQKILVALIIRGFYAIEPSGRFSCSIRENVTKSRIIISLDSKVHTKAQLFHVYRKI